MENQLQSGELRDEIESEEALARSSLKSENTMLLGCVNTLEEHNQLLERICQLQKEHNTIADRTQSSSFTSSQPSKCGLRFDKHTLKYKG
jgi:2-iminoacetate synthase ThiH